MLFVALIALGFVIALSRESDEGKSLSPEEWQRALEEQTSSSKDASADQSAQDKALVDLYKQHKNAPQQPVETSSDANVGRLTRRGDVPPEYPQSDDDLGVGGDMDKLPDNLFAIVDAALLELNDPVGLFEVADSIEGAGYPLSANRLKRKALRLLAEGDVDGGDVAHVS